MTYRKISNRSGTRYSRFILGIRVDFHKSQRGWFYSTLGWPTMQAEIGPFRDRRKAVQYAAKLLAN